MKRFRCVIMPFLLIAIYQATCQTALAQREPAGRWYELSKSANPYPGRRLDSGYAGKPISSLPASLTGVWGGRLQVWKYESFPIYKELFPEEIIGKSIIFQKGRDIELNLEFVKDSSGRITLAPVKGLIMIPQSQFRQFSNQLDSKGDSRMKIFLEKHGDKLEFPITIHLHDAKSDENSRGIAKTQFESRVVQQQSCILSENLYEHQVILDGTKTGTKGTFRLNDENVYLLKIIPNQNYLYVRIVSVTADKNRGVLHRSIYSGNLVRGRRVDVDASSRFGMQLKNIK